MVFTFYSLSYAILIMSKGNRISRKIHEGFNLKNGKGFVCMSAPGTGRTRYNLAKMPCHAWDAKIM